jgi:creatinine amidohydrolase
MTSVFLHEITAREAQLAIDGSGRILVPLGSTEQHGAHCPLGTDALIATEVCRRVAPELDAVVAPTIAFGVSPEHEGFPGLITLSASTLVAVLADVCASLLDTGFRSVVVINGHYTNIVALHQGVAAANTRSGKPGERQAFWLSYWDALPANESGAYLGPEVGLHANEGETSVVMAIEERLVDLGHATAEYPEGAEGLSQAVVEAYFFSRPGALRRALPSGVWGDPSNATAEIGERWLNAVERGLPQAIVEVERLFARYDRDPETGR